MAMAHADSASNGDATDAADADVLTLPPHMRVRRKIVYFTVGQRKEVAVFEDGAAAEDVKNLFSSAAEAGPSDILKMYSPQGALVNINSRSLESNRPDAPYRLELVAAHYNNGFLPEHLQHELTYLDHRISELERRMNEMTSLYPHDVQLMREELEQHKQVLGLYRTGAPFRHSGMGRPFWNRHKARRKSEAEKRLVCDKFLYISSMTLTEEIRCCLRMPTFDNWQWEDEEILLLLQQMYIDLDLLRKFDIPLDVLQKFLCQVYMNYNEVPFHNFQHCFTVSQMMYGIIWCLDLPAKIGDLETFILLTSCICHDLDHPGFNNIYQINARTELALRYNDISPLENHHCSVAFNILADPSANIFQSFAPDTYKTVREGIIRCILATDMARHNEILNQFNQIAPVFDYANRAHVNLLCMVLIKVSDISNEARPMDVAEPWLDCLLQEFFEQSDREKLEGLPVTPFMDRDKITKPSSQCSFIGFVLLPLFEAIGRLYPALEDLIVNPVREALDYYRKLNEASKDTRSRRSLEPPPSPGPNEEHHVADSANNNNNSSSGGKDEAGTSNGTDDAPLEHQPPSRKTSLQSIDADDAAAAAAAARKADQPVISVSDQETSQHQHLRDPNAPPPTPVSRDRSLSSHEDEIRRFSFGLDPDTFTEVEVCEKTFSFKISTDIGPKTGWSNSSAAATAAAAAAAKLSGAALRRASLAVMSAAPEPVKVRSGNLARSATTSPTHMMHSPGAVIIEEEEIGGVPASPVVLVNGDVKDEQPPRPQTPVPQPNGSAVVPKPAADPCPVEEKSAPPPGSPPSRSPSRDGALLSRIRTWTSSLRSPKKTASAASAAAAAAAQEPSSAVPANSSDPVESSRSPRLGARKVSQSLSRLFSRSCSRSASKDLPASPVSSSVTNSPEPVHHAVGRRSSSGVHDASAPPPPAAAN